jgi:protein involved in temperature-dependent protein secretion
MLGREAADPGVLNDVDLLIAFQDYDKAKLLLEKTLRENPTNPEYRLRMLHLQAATGNKDKAELEARILAEMMEGPLSDTIRRVKEIGRGLMPGHPLFDDTASLDEAKQLLDKIDGEEQQGAAQLSQDGSVHRDTVDFFNLISEEDELIGEEDEVPPGRSDGGEDSEALVEDEDRAETKARSADGDAATQAAAASTPLSLETAPPKLEAAPPKSEVTSPKSEAAPPKLEAAPPKPEVAPPKPEVSPPKPEVSPPKPEVAPPKPEAAPPKPEAAPPKPEVSPPKSEAAPPKPEAAPPKPEVSPPKPEAEPPKPEAAPPPKLEAAPVASKEDAASADSAMKKMEKTMFFSEIRDEAGSPSADATGGDDETIDVRKAMRDRKAADPNTLREIDTLIAFEAYDKARLLLKKSLRETPTNPEYRLRMLHLEATTGDKEKAALEERMIAEMMEGPLSDTIRRVKEIGRGLMPGHPLFDDAKSLDEAKQLLDKIESEEQQEAAQPSQDGSGQRDIVNLGETVDFFNLISAEDELTSEEDEAAAGRSDGGGDAETLAKDEDRAKAKSRDADRDAATQAAASADAAGSDQGKIDWTKTMLDRKAADPNALKEVDTLIAFEAYDKAKVLLKEILKGNPANPEYRLRMLHLEATTGDKDKAELEERILAEMMEGPLSDTIRRVKEIGRGLMPGNPLFDDAETLDEAKQLLDKFESEEQQEPAQASQGGSGQRDIVNLAETVDFFNLISAEDELTSEEDEAPAGRSDGGGGDGSKKP